MISPKTWGKSGPLDFLCQNLLEAGFKRKKVKISILDADLGIISGIGEK